jgi:phosphoglycerate dehydrogenase-like enzyme
MKIVLNYSPSEPHWDELRHAAQGARLDIATDEASARDLVHEADAVLGNRYFLQSIERATRLRWFQSNSVGMDLVLRARDYLRDVTVTNVRGIYSTEMAEHATALVSSLFRGLHELRDAQRDKRWAPRVLRTISGSSFLILGWGSVGAAIGKRLRALGGVVRGVGRTRTVVLSAGGEELLSAGADWRVLLPEVDCVVMALPLTSRTRGIVGDRELASMKSTAYVVNVGRGGTLVESALIAALKESRLAGAALDVFEDEPIENASALWSIPSLLITPHVARSREQMPPYKWESLFVENLRRFVEGRPLLNVVDLEREY